MSAPAVAIVHFKDPFVLNGERVFALTPKTYGLATTPDGVMATTKNGHTVILFPWHAISHVVFDDARKGGKK